MTSERMRTILKTSLIGTVLAFAAAPVSDAAAASVRGAGSDTATIGAGGSTSAGNVVNVPIFVRDESATPLGIDRPPGSRIQGLAFRVDFPPGTVTAASIAPSGITAGLTPLFGPSSNFAANSVNYLVSYAEAGNAIPFTLDGAPPGNAVAQLSFTLAPNAPVGVYALTFNTASELSNQAGTVAENVGNGGLVLVSGSFGVTSNAARGLYASAQSSSSILLTWIDPNLIETGFRVERSTDGVSYAPLQTVGANVTSFTDTLLPANTLRYYRLITVTAAGDGHASNRATASTFPAAATNVCVAAQTISRRWARAPAATYRGPDWGLVYQDRDDGTRDQVFFQSLDGTTLANLGPRVQVSKATTAARAPAIGWNGTHYAVTWFESVVAGPGAPLDIGLRFAQLDGNGAILRTPVRIPVTPASASETSFDIGVAAEPHWDGTHWGLFTTRVTPSFNATIDYRRLQPSGRVVVGPAPVASAPDAFLTRVEAAWNPASNEYGVAWMRRKDNTWELQFQRVEESNGLPLLGAPTTVASLIGSNGFVGLGIVVNPAGGWLVAWTECDEPLTECAAYSRRVAANGTPDAGGKVRVSAPPPRDENELRLIARPGGFAVFIEGFETGVSEVVRYHLDATGAPDGLGPTLVSIDDSRNSGLRRVASDGTRALVAWNESASTLEVAGRLSDGGSGALGPQVAFTTGHDPGNTTGLPGTTQPPRIVPVGAGFIATWLELDSGTSLIHARLFNGTGALVANYAPFSANATNGRPGVAQFGDSFGVAWRSGGNLRFTRIGGNGTPMVSETVVATGTGGDQTVELGWDGENFVAVWAQGGYRYLRIGANGVAIGTPQLLPLGAIAPSNVFRIAWMGDAWALLFRSASDFNMYYARFTSDGSVPLAPTQLSNAIPVGTGGDPSLIYNGQQLGAAWNELSIPGLNPPGFQGRFTLLNRDGTEVFPDLAPNPTPIGTGRQQLYYGAGRFHLVYGMESHFQVGMRELDLDLIAGGATGTPGRFLANRHNVLTGVAHNGVSLGIVWNEPDTGDVHMQTDACLADPSPPPCPNVSIASSNNEVQLSWPPVSDAQSGLWRYHVFRDGRILIELPNTATSFADSGYDSAVIHGYQVRAMNRAFQESVGCPTRNFSTVVGDANGNGILDVADIFYLINFTLASGPSPLGDADANGDGAVSVTDVFFLINFFFGGGPPPTSIERH